MMCDSSPLTFETLLKDPMARAVMRSDRVSVQDLVSVLCAAREALALREPAAVRQALVRGAAGRHAGHRNISV